MTDDPYRKLKLEDIQHTARLAHIALTDEEAAELLTEINDRLLPMIQEIREVDITGVEPYQSTASQLKTRPDEITSNEAVEDILANAPERVDNFFAVPKVLPE